MLCFNQFLLLSDKFTDLKKRFCNKIVINPIANSTADSTKKKKVKDNKFILSYKNPIDKTTIYNVIHSSSAVNNKCIELTTLLLILSNIKKNSKKYKFKSPTIINYIK